MNYKGNQIYSSLVMPNAYFNTTLILIDYINKDFSDYGGGKRPDIGKEYDDPMYEMLNPLLYNLKHGIELYCKTFLNLGKDNFDKIHDIKLLFCKFKCLCLELNFNKETNITPTTLNEIEKIIENLYNKDNENDVHRYPNTNDFLTYQGKAKNKYSLKIPHICNHKKNEWETKSQCIQNIQKIIIKLWNFFEKIGKEKYFEEKIKEKIEKHPL